MKRLVPKKGGKKMLEKTFTGGLILGVLGVLGFQKITNLVKENNDLRKEIKELKNERKASENDDKK